MALVFAVPVRSIGEAPLPLPSRRSMQFVATLAAVVLLALAVEGWVPRVLHESAPEVRASSTVDADRVVQQVAHTPVAVRPGGLQVEDHAYTATFDGRGFAYTPTDATMAFQLSLSGIERGGSALAIRPEPWAAERRARPHGRWPLESKNG